ncbi:MAG: hypothetical protein ACTSR3_01275 [Candidatus Helarchaeota archaeon]
MKPTKILSVKTKNEDLGLGIKLEMLITHPDPKDLKEIHKNTLIWMYVQVKDKFEEMIQKYLRELK